MKTCSKCKEEKELIEFGKCVKNKDWLKRKCKICVKAYNVSFQRTLKGKLGLAHSHQVEKSKRRGHKPPNYTRKEFIDRYINNKDYLTLYNNWVKSDYNNLLSPSFDRLDDYKPYTFDNLQMITWGENNKKANSDRRNGINNKISKAVIGTHIKTSEQIEFYSAKEAGRNGFNDSHIIQCCKGNIRQHLGYFWEYKNK